MRISSIVEALVEAKATPEMILAAVRAAESEQINALERRREADRSRKARQRENSKCHVTSRDVTVTERDKKQKESSPHTPLEEKQKNISSLRSDIIPPYSPPTNEKLKRRKQGYTEAFEQFWSQWRDIGGGGDKAPAFKAFQKMDGADRQAAFDLARPWFLDWRQSHPDISPIHASTYLNNRRFDGFDPQAVRVVPHRGQGPPRGVSRVGMMNGSAELLEASRNLSEEWMDEFDRARGLQ